MGGHGAPGTGHVVRGGQLPGLLSDAGRAMMKPGGRLFSALRPDFGLGLCIRDGDGDAERRGDVACCRHDAGGAHDGRDGDQDVLQLFGGQTALERGSIWAA